MNYMYNTIITSMNKKNNIVNKSTINHYTPFTAIPGLEEGSHHTIRNFHDKHCNITKSSLNSLNK